MRYIELLPNPTCVYHTHIIFIISTLRRSWDQLKTETENIGRLHMQLSMKIQEEMLKSVKDFRIQQKEIRKKVRV